MWGSLVALPIGIPPFFVTLRAYALLPLRTRTYFTVPTVRYQYLGTSKNVYGRNACAAKPVLSKRQHGSKPAHRWANAAKITLCWRSVTPIDNL